MQFIPKKLRGNLTKEEIALTKGYMKWYRVVEDELRLFVNERALNDNKQPLNKIYWKEKRAELCIDELEYFIKFYDKFKDYKPRVFIKSDVGALYSEYEVEDWGLNDKVIEIKFM